MLIIENNHLKVEVLDPQKDIDKLGSRYCSGGQIFQVYDKNKGALLSGPTFPDTYNTFCSQGLPDAFNAYPGLDSAEIGDLIMAIGVGLVRYENPIKHSFAKENTNVVEPLDWKIQKADNALGFYAIHDYKDYSYALTREIILENRELILVNVLENCSSAPMPLSWFAHPFLPLTNDGVVGHIPAKYELNNFYSLDKNGELKINLPKDYSADKYDSVVFNVGKVNDDDEDFLMTLKHKLIGNVEIDCGFPVDSIPVWFCDKAFSPEPYLVDTLEPNENAQWEITYKF